MPLGCVVDGRVVDEIGLDQNVEFEELSGMLGAVHRWGKKEESGGGGGGGGGGGEQKEDDSTSRTLLYETQPLNCFSLRVQEKVQDYEISIQVLRERWQRTKKTTTTASASAVGAPSSNDATLDGCGSLNTTFDYGPLNGPDVMSTLPKELTLLHQYYLSMEKLCIPSIQLNHNLYLLWKFQNYATVYHQDVHITPHFTLYSQTSGASVFHFLPILIGLFVAYKVPSGNEYPTHVEEILQALDEQQVGHVAVVGPGQMALIMPSGSHGVFVPLVERRGVGGGGGGGGRN